MEFALVVNFLNIQNTFLLNLLQGQTSPFNYFYPLTNFLIQNVVLFKFFKKKKKRGEGLNRNLKIKERIYIYI